MKTGPAFVLSHALRLGAVVLLVLGIRAAEFGEVVGGLGGWVGDMFRPVGRDFDFAAKTDWLLALAFWMLGTWARRLRWPGGALRDFDWLAVGALLAACFASAVSLSWLALGLTPDSSGPSPGLLYPWIPLPWPAPKSMGSAVQLLALAITAGLVAVLARRAYERSRAEARVSRRFRVHWLGSLRSGCWSTQRLRSRARSFDSRHP